MKSKSQNTTATLSSEVLALIELCRKNEEETEFQELRTNATALGQAIVKEPSSNEQREIMAYAFRWVGHASIQCVHKESTLDGAMELAVNCLAELKKLGLDSTFPHVACLEHSIGHGWEKDEQEEERDFLLRIDKVLDASIKVHVERKLDDLPILLRFRSEVQSDLAHCEGTSPSEANRCRHLSETLFDQSDECLSAIALDKRFSPSQRNEASKKADRVIYALVLAFVVGSLIYAVT